MATAAHGFVKGQRVQANRDLRVIYSSSGGYNPFTVLLGSVGTVTSVASGRLSVKFDDATHTYPILADQRSAIGALDPNAPVPPAPRKIGEMPEGDHISADDPRIAWLWEDAAKYANDQGYCSYYDKIAEALSIPGRERSFRVTTTINGLSATINVKARSRKLAEAIVAEKVANAVGSVATGE